MPRFGGQSRKLPISRLNALAKGQSGINFPVANDTLGIQPSTSVGRAFPGTLTTACHPGPATGSRLRQ